MMRMMRSEWLKLRGTVIWMTAIVSPLLAVLLGVLEFRDGGTDGGSRDVWVEALAMMGVMHAMLFLPLLTGVFAAWICRYEHAGGGWKQLLALPVTRLQVYVVKGIYVLLLLAMTQLLFLAGLLAVGTLLGFEGAPPWGTIAKSLIGGWVACLPLAALQLAVSTAWTSFGASLAVNVILTLPNMLVANSATYGPYYPWAQPLLAMLPRGEEYGFGAFNVSMETLLFVILGSFVVFAAGGWIYFRRKAV